jgi:TatD DNase family protein
VRNYSVKNFWVDTHAHLYSDEFAPDRADIIARAEAAQVMRLFMPNVDERSIEPMLQLEEQFPGSCIAMMGLHPCSVNADFRRGLYAVEEWLSRRHFAAVGEIGTDLYWDKTFWEQQKEAFDIQVSLAVRHDLPVVIHCRESIDETIQLLEKFEGKARGIFHCFTGSAEQAKRIIAMNFFLGIGGVSTFKKGGLDLVLPHIPLDRIVLETDSPYLAPVPHRGKRNEPAYIPLIGMRVASVLNASVDDVQAQTTKNALQLFQHSN